MPRSPVFALICVISVVTLAADDKPVRAPYVESGDCWSYHAENFENRGPVDDFQLCVTFVDKQKDVIKAVTTVKSDGREIDVTFTADWGTLVSSTGRIFTPPARIMKFPLRVGDAYTVEFEYRNTLNGAMAGKQKYEMKVVGWEDVIVPAGRFRALKIEGSGPGERYDRQVRYSAKITYWYAPEVNQKIKYEFIYPNGRESVELTGYKLNK